MIIGVYSIFMGRIVKIELSQNFAITVSMMNSLCSAWSLLSSIVLHTSVIVSGIDCYNTKPLSMPGYLAFVITTQNLCTHRDERKMPHKMFYGGFDQKSFPFTDRKILNIALKQQNHPKAKDFELFSVFFLSQNQN